jgi:demethylmenaquinone methyltransferase / 2-methoxy-6-polyprenyl-1,4-benzoquinol methylase
MDRATLDKDPSDVARMFDGVAARYDLANDVLSLGQDRLWRKATIRALGCTLGDRVLDIAGGTGTSSEPLADAGVDVVPADFSLGMLRVGRRRRPDMAFTAADATHLPFADGSFDAVTMSFGLRNVSEPAAALAEFRRVTRPGGRLVVCEFSRPINRAFRCPAGGRPPGVVQPGLVRVSGRVDTGVAVAA